MAPLQNFHGSGYLSLSSRHRRATWATAVALACGIFGGAIGLRSLVTGHQFDFPPPQAAVDLGVAELSYDFATLEAKGSATAPREGARPPDTTNAGIEKRCAQSTWPFFDNECLWGKVGEERRHKRIVSRLKSPWCSGLRSKEGAYICRPRT
jgi:hypothetical protein